MYIIEQFYRVVLKKNPPYYAKYPFGTIVWKPIRKYLNVVIIPNIPFSSLRIRMYRMLGFTIGKNVFIGMKCYMDDMDPKQTTIGDNVTISYGTYFACHGKKQNHTFIKIENGVYIGMRCNIISGRVGITIGENSIIGAGSLVNKDVLSKAIVAGIPIEVKGTCE